MRYFFIVLVLALSSPCFADSSNSYPPPPPDGYVPNASTAIAIARAILIPIYGDSIPKDAAFKADRKGDVWYVHRALECPPPGVCLGGAENVLISAKDGQILSAYRHG